LRQTTRPTTRQKTRPFFKIETYHSLKKVLRSINHDEHEVHVFGTRSLAINIEDKFGIKTKSLDQLFQSIFPDYHSKRTQIYFQSILRKEIETGNYKNKNYLLNRLSSIVLTFYLFADFQSNEIVGGLENVKNDELIRLVNRLLQDEIVKKYHFRWKTITKKEISERICGSSNVEKITIYEVEYLNFARMNLIHWLREKGFTITFRVPFHKEFPNSYVYWNKLYQVAARQQLEACESLVNTPIGNGYKFGMFNEKFTIMGDKQDRDDIQILEFPSPNDFRMYFNKHKNETFVSVDHEMIEAVVHNKKIKAYEDEFGKLVYFIQFCKNIDGTIYLEFNTLTELITSGWVRTADATGDKALSLLIDLQEYMDGTETINDVIERLERLQELEFVSRSFDRENAQDTGKNYMKRYMLNPFRTFSFLNQGRYAVTTNQLIDLVRQLEKLCHYLVIEDGHTVNVNEYLKRWQNVLNKLEFKGKDNDWYKVFSARVSDTWEFAYPELLSLIYIIASERETEREVYSISQLQEFVISGEEPDTLHITNLTLENFPETHKNVLSEFFDYSEIKQYIKRTMIGPLKNVLLHSLWVDHTVKETFEELAAYQLFNILSNYEGSIKLSWIEHLHENSIRSVYLDIFADLYAAGKIEIWEDHELDIDFKTEIENKQQSSVDLNSLKEKVPDLYWLDHDFCSKKFFLTTFIEKQPIYGSDFHQQLLFGKIGKLFSYSDNERNQFRKLIYPLFPHWTNTKKDNLIDTEYKTFLTKYKHFENITYPRELKGLQILRSVYRENRRTKARNQYRRNRNYNEDDLLKQFKENIEKYEVKAEPGNHCKMCPHLKSCLEGMYSIDNISQ
jgi:hypothetical protein